ncbi:hypothetical protein MRX96_056405 [Rhipicephalus microplus]
MLALYMLAFQPGCKASLLQPGWKEQMPDPRACLGSKQLPKFERMARRSRNAGSYQFAADQVVDRHDDADENGHEHKRDGEHLSPAWVHVVAELEWFVSEQLSGQDDLHASDVG